MQSTGTTPIIKPTTLFVLAAFDRGEDSELKPAFSWMTCRGVGTGDKQVQTEKGSIDQDAGGTSCLISIPRCRDRQTGRSKQPAGGDDHDAAWFDLAAR